MSQKRVLITGGAGYIGSHFIRRCRAHLPPLVVLDNLVNGHRASVPRDVPFIRGDLQNPADVEKVFRRHPIDAVVHFAAYAEVGESVRDPRKYYLNNVGGGLNLLNACVRHGVKRFIFSSTAATYGVPKKTPIPETAPQNPVNPYGASKLMFERILLETGAQNGLAVGILRYFNAAGAATDATLGEHHEPESHLIPNVLLSLLKPGRPFRVFGDDYPTPDGSCIRDYIHVDDLADAHLLLLRRLRHKSPLVYNVGCQKGYSIFDVLHAAEKITGRKIRYTISPRRPGDPPVLVADTRRIRRELGWKPRHSLDKIIASAWSWHRTRPDGYA